LNDAALPQAIVDTLQGFQFAYPFVMAWVWIAGALLFWILHERRGPSPNTPPTLDAGHKAAVLVPCHNEARQLRETVLALTRLRHPNFEIVVIDDGSTDGTLELAHALATRHRAVRVVRLRTNQGKAAALRAGAAATDARYLICIDGDCLLDEDALTWMVAALERHPRVGGVTGNPRIRTRSTTLGRLQVGEFSTLIGLIKRSQMVCGRLFTVSGVICGFRREALAAVGYWRSDVLTEDVDVSWRLQLAGWRLAFEPRALAWILMPETLRGLWRQRLRWATGAAQVFVRSLRALVRRDALPMWPTALEYVASVAWAWTTVTLAAVWTIQLLAGPLFGVRIGGLVPEEWGIALGAIFLVQIAVGMSLDRRYEPGVGRYFLSVLSYPIAFWILMSITVVVGWPRALFGGRRGPAVWVSPDRGLERAR
jgi:biofilm PGA synthesis N-glycosyltransferase PgaC